MPIETAADWQSLFENQMYWRIGYSARTLAYCWLESKAIQKI